MIPGSIRNLEQYKQAKLLDMTGFGFERNISPTDIDFFVEISCKEFVLGEYKRAGAVKQKGQLDAFTNLLKMLNNSGVLVLGFWAEHEVPTEQIIVAREVKVVDIWCTQCPEWTSLRDYDVSVLSLIQKWRTWGRDKDFSTL